MRYDPGLDDGRGLPGPQPRWARRLVAVQAVVLVPVIYLWLGPASRAAAASPGPDLGAGLVGLILMVLGLPWSVFVCLFDNRYEMFDSRWRDLFVIGPAVVNLGLAALSLWWTSRHPVDQGVAGGPGRRSGGAGNLGRRSRDFRAPPGSEKPERTTQSPAGEPE